MLAGAAAEGLPVYLYGSTPQTLERLVPALLAKLPDLKTAGVEPSKFRLAEPGEAARIAERIRASGARIVLVALGCRRQEIFVYAMRPHLDAPLLAVGVAFDYHAGLLRTRRRGCSGAAWSGCGGWGWSRPGCGAVTCC